MCVRVFACADANSCIISVGVQERTCTPARVFCVCVCWAHAKVIGQCNQHSTVVHEAGRLAAIVQLSVSGEEQRRLETHGT